MDANTSLEIQIMNIQIKTKMMNRIIALSVLTLISISAFAQWVSPSESRSFTLTYLSEAAPEVVEKIGSTFIVKQDITISSTDTLLIADSDSCVNVYPEVKIEILGTLFSEERATPFKMFGLTTPEDEYFEVRFDSSAGSVMKKVDIENCRRIFLTNSDVKFSECEFHGFSSHVISYMNCSPAIEHCNFHDNAACAIQSAINTEGSPKILYNRMYNNVLANTNNPQINIGPSANDTILIVGNTIEGLASTMSGGIGISNLYNPNTTLVVVRDNIVKCNRYGFTQNGYRISSWITDNQFIYNNLEVNPNNGGSGISIFGYDATCASTIRRNLITGNLWGITAIYYNNIDLGTEDDPGRNLIYDNANNGVEYALFNNSNSDIEAVGNYWGYDNASDVENVIYHQADSNIYGLVNYLPFNVITPEITSFSFKAADNSSISQDAYGEFLYSANYDTVYVQVNCSSDQGCTYLRPEITAPAGVMVSPSSGELVNFASPVVFTATTPHQTSKDYVVVVDFRTSVLDVRKDGLIEVYPNPVAGGFINIYNRQDSEYRCEIVCQDGRVVGEHEVLPGMNRAAVNHLAPGLYVLRFYIPEGLFEKRIIIK